MTDEGVYGRPRQTPAARASNVVNVTKRRVVVVLASSLALVACGSDDDARSAETAATSVETLATATNSAGADVNESVPETAETAETAATSGDTDATPESVAPTVVTSGEQAPGTAATGAGGGHCRVTITGAVTDEWTSDASGFQAFVYGGWLADPSEEDKDSFGLNCYDPDYDIVGFSATPGTSVPMAPGVYDIGSAGDSGAPIQADVALLFDDGLWEPISGTLEVTEFDEHHISGTFSLSIEDSFDPTRTAEVTGEFAHSN